MNIAKQDITIKRGDDISRQINFYRVKKEQGNKVRTRLDISSLKRIDMHIKSNGKIQLRLSTEDKTILVKNKALGEVILVFKSSTTQKLKFTDGEYDMQFITASGKIKTILEGAFELDRDITKV